MNGSGARRTGARAFTLIEVVLVIGILLAISALVLPNFLRQFKQDELPRSGRQLRSLITLTRAHAAFDGKRYRIRFPGEDDLESLDGSEQPLIEREDDPIEDPDIFKRISAPWVVGDIFLGEVRCAEVRLGKPTIQRLQDLRNRTGDDIARALKKEDKLDQLDPERPPLLIEPDGTSEWATFVLTTAPAYLALDELDDQPRVEVILDGTTGLAWLQRPFYDEELDLFEEKGWAAVLRQDFLNPRVLTEDDVLELRETSTQGRKVQMRGRELQTEP